VNAVTLKVEPAIPEGTVRIERETDIDKMKYIFDAGALFIDQNVDADFKQIVHSQQEVRDGFIKLRSDVLPLVQGLQEALKQAQEASEAAQEAADAAEEAAQTARSAENVINNDGRNQQQLNDIFLATTQYITFYMFGARTTIADNRDAIIATYQYSNLHKIPIVEKSGAVYTYGDAINMQLEYVNIDSDVTLSGKGITIQGTITDITPVTAPVLNRGSTQLSITGPINPDDVLLIRDKTTSSFSAHRTYYYRGEMRGVQAYASGVVTLDSPLEDTYSATNLEIALIKPVKINIKGGFKTITSDAYSLRIRYASNFYIDATVMNINGSTAGLSVAKSYRGTIVGKYYKTGNSSTGTDYGLSIGNSQDIIIKPTFAFGYRHAIATGGDDTVGSVPCRRIRIDGGILANDPASQLHVADFHGNTIDSSYSNSTIFGRVSLSGYNTKSRSNTLVLPAGDVRAPIALNEVVGGVIGSYNDTIYLSDSTAVLNWGTSTFANAVVKPLRVDLIGLRTFGVGKLIGLMSMVATKGDQTINLDDFELENVSTLTRLITYVPVTGNVTPKLFRVKNPDYKLPNDIIILAGATGLDTARDFYTRSGTSTGGTWVQYGDGRMEITQRLTLGRGAVNIAFGSLFKTPTTRWNFPKAFADASKVVVNMTPVDAVSVSNIVAAPTTTYVDITTITAQQYANASWAVAITAKGTWF
ncbi:TPA: hypothetical protein N2619_004546, partial [Salmonella enterica]|nr:hypothetical protein [Salmonella enterica]